MLPQSLLDSAPAGLLVTDRALRVIQVNRWLVTHSGIDSTYLVGRALGEAFPELAERGLLATYDFVIQNQQPFSLSGRSYHYFVRLPPTGAAPDILEMPQSVVILPMIDEAGVVGTLTVIIDITGQVELERDLNREVARLRALLDIDRSLTTLDLRECLQTIVERACILFGADSAALLLFEDGYLHHAAGYGLQGDVADLVFHPNRGLTGWAVRNGRSVLVPDVLQDDRYLAVNPRTRSEMVAPLIVHDQCIGALNVESAQWNTFSQSDLDLLESFASRAAVAIHNAQLHTAELKQRVLAETLRDSGLALAAQLDPDAVLDRLLQDVVRVVPYDSASVMWVEADRVRIMRHYGYDRFRLEDLANHFDAPLNQLDNLWGMALSRRPAVVPDVRHDAKWMRKAMFPHVESWCGAPIMAHGQVLGFLSLDKIDSGFYTSELADRLAAFAAQAGLALENARLYAEQQRLAVTDSLTALANRRRFDEELEREVQRAHRFKRSVALLMVDIDNFKRFNDTYGHPAGDELLRSLAVVLRENIRAVDTPARYGGEEFSLILPEADVSAAFDVAERLRLGVAHHPLPAALTSAASVTVSIGVAVMPAHAMTAEALIQAADSALYQAKRTGKNRVVMFGS